jgi:N-acetylglutamate synthase-like GNAT family acetyltransferase
MQIDICQAKKGEIPRIIEILKTYNMGDFGSNERPFLPRIENFFIAKNEDGLIGCAAFLLYNDSKLAKTKREAETASLAVDRKYRGYGIGEKLQKARLKRMKQLGIKKVLTEADTPAIIEWYIRKFGYKKVVTRKKYSDNYGDPNSDTYTLLELNL